MNKIIIIVVFVCFSFFELYAQNRVGSPYTRYGIGDINNIVQTRNKSMGGLAYTIPYRYSIDFVNPALTSNIDSLTFIFDFGVQGESRIYSVENPPVSMQKSDFNLTYINFGFPINKWWKVSAGLIPFSNVSYSIAAEDSAFNVPKTYLYNGNGGVNRVFINNAFVFHENIRLGVLAGYNFGKIYQSNGIKFDGSDGGLLNIVEQNSFQINDFNFEVGLFSKYKINQNNKLLLGLVYGYNDKLTAYRSTVIYNTLSVGSSVIQDTIFHTDSEKGTIGLPQKIGIGLGYLLNDKFYIGIDYTNMSWNNSPFFEELDTLRNSNIISLGTEYVPAGLNTNPLRYSQGIIYRGGAFFKQTFMSFSGTEYPINDFGISFGLGLPIKRSKTVFNFSIQVGQRGSLENSLIQEKYFILSLSFNLGDTWFIKGKFD